MLFPKKYIPLLAVSIIFSLCQTVAVLHAAQETVFNYRNDPIFKVQFDRSSEWEDPDKEAILKGFRYVANVLKKAPHGMTPVVDVKKKILGYDTVAQYGSYYNLIESLAGPGSVRLHGQMEFNKFGIVGIGCSSPECYTSTTIHELGHGLFLGKSKADHKIIHEALQTHLSQDYTLNVSFDGSHFHNLPLSIMLPNQQDTIFPGYMEVELALLNRQHQNTLVLDPRDLFGFSFYQNNQTFENNHVYFARNRTGTAYITHFYNENPFGIGFHLYGSHNTITQNGNLLTKGEQAVGIRVDGEKNTLTIAPNTEVHALGKEGVGLLFAHGTNHTLTVHGSLAGGKQAIYASPESHISSIYITPSASVEGDIVQERRSGIRKFFPKLSSLYFGPTPGQKTSEKFIYTHSVWDPNMKVHFTGSYTGLYGSTHTLYNATVHSGALLAGNSTFILEKKPFLLRPFYRESGVFRNEGILSPSRSENEEDPNASFGHMQINGTFKQTPTGKLVIDVAPGQVSDKVHVTKTAHLDGTLEIRPQFGFYQSSEEFSFLKADGGIRGDFQHFITPQSPTLNWKKLRKNTSYGVSVLSSGQYTPSSSTPTIIPHTPDIDIKPPGHGDANEGDRFSFPNNDQDWYKGWSILSGELAAKKQAYEEALRQVQIQISEVDRGFYEEENAFKARDEALRMKIRDPHEEVRERAHKDTKELLQDWIQMREKYKALREGIIGNTLVSLKTYKEVFEEVAKYRERWKSFRDHQEIHAPNHGSSSQLKKIQHEKEAEDSSLETETEKLLNSIVDEKDNTSLREFEAFLESLQNQSALKTQTAIADEPFRPADAYSQYGHTAAERSIGKALDRLVGVAKKPLSEFYAALDFSNPDGSEIRKALSDLSTVAYGGTFSASLDRELLISDTLRTHSALPIAPNGRWSGFALPFTGRLEQKAKDLQIGYSLRTSGIIMGVEQTSPSLKGMTWGMHGVVTQKDRLTLKTGDKANGTLQAWGLGAQMRYQPHPRAGADITAHVRLGLEQGSLSRTIEVDSITPYRTDQKAKWLAWTHSASLSGAYLWPLTANLSIGPVAGINYVSITRPQMLEHGSQGLDIALESTQAYTLRSSFGLRGVFLMTDAFTINVEALWNRDLLNKKVKQEASFSGYQDSFFSAHTLSGAPQNFQMRSQMTYDISSNVRLGAQLSLQFARGVKPQPAGNLTAILRF